MTDLDKSGPNKRLSRFYLGPSLGWTDTPENVITVAAGGVTIIDQSTSLVMVNFNGAVTIQLPSAIGAGTSLGTLVGLPVTIVDIGGFASANPITILPFGTELIMGLASIQVATNYGAFQLIPNVTSGGWNNQ